MDLDNGYLTQVTGEEDNYIYSYLGKLEWSGSGDKILFTGSYQGYSTLYTVEVD
jgi:hypothetical protein